MNFASNEFLFLFLPATIALVWFLAGRLHREHLCLLIFGISSTFYLFHSVYFYFLLLASILSNYGLGNLVSQRRSALVIGIVFNLSILFTFKYFNFFTAQFGYDALNIALPLAISFYTFQQISFLVDRFAGRIESYPTLITYAAYVTFFPQLVAGPIVRFGQVSRRLLSARPFKVSLGRLRLGGAWLVIGLFKKVVLADSLGSVAEAAYTNVAQLTFLDAWIGTLAFGLQIYFDFSAYTDIAIGCGLILGLRLPENFDRPYRATNISEFWRRWHMTLSRFLRDYLYIPLGGNRHGPWRRVLNVFIVMLLGGLWHGANWTFVLWGGLHGLFLAFLSLWRKFGIALPSPAGWFLTFLFVTLAWVAFRANDIDDAARIWLLMAGTEGVVLPPSASGLARLIGAETEIRPLAAFNLLNLMLVLGALAVVLLAPTTRQFALWRRRPLTQASILGVLFALAVILMQDGSGRFIYFVF